MCAHPTRSVFLFGSLCLLGLSGLLGGVFRLCLLALFLLYVGDRLGVGLSRLGCLRGHCHRSRTKHKRNRDENSDQLLDHDPTSLSFLLWAGAHGTRLKVDTKKRLRIECEVFKASYRNLWATQRLRLDAEETREGLLSAAQHGELPV